MGPLDRLAQLIEQVIELIVQVIRDDPHFRRNPEQLGTLNEFLRMLRAVLQIINQIIDHR
jgi:hypothetical protein